jgi:hypothetical protein
VLAGDAETMARLGVSYDELADALDELLATVLEMWFKPVQEEHIAQEIARQTDSPDLYSPESIPHFDMYNLPDIQWGFLVNHLQVFIFRCSS